MAHRSTQYNGTINVDEKAKVGILAGILGISVAQVYQDRQAGKLPANPETTYRDNIQFYINWYKQRAISKSSTMIDAKLEQDIRNGVAKEEMAWLDIREKRAELIDKYVFAETIEPIFYLIKSGLVNLAREMPETTEKVDSILRGWATLGERIQTEAKEDGDSFVKTKMETVPDVILEIKEERQKEQDEFYDNKHRLNGNDTDS